MNITGACYCKAVRFSALSHTPYPYMRCYCSFCRKTSGSGGYGINIMAEAGSLKVEGKENMRYHLAWEHDPDTDELVQNENHRYFCRHCGSPLWAADPRWPQWIYPYASVIDTALPVPPEIVHIMLDFVAPWVEIPQGEHHKYFKRYPDESIIDWHRRHELFQE